MLQHALKEWSIAVDALTQGQTILLLRKGGICEVGKQFSVPHQRVWLYPTYEHQKPHLLKPKWAEKVTSVESGWHPTQIILQAWADISHVWTVRNPDALATLLPFHIWNEHFVTERFSWKPSQPLHLLLLRVYGLTTPISIDWHPIYGGCRSWLTLKVPVNETLSSPVLDEQTWLATLETIHHQIATFDSGEPLQVNEII